MMRLKSYYVTLAVLTGGSLLTTPDAHAQALGSFPSASRGTMPQAPLRQVIPVSPTPMRSAPVMSAPVVRWPQPGQGGNVFPTSPTMQPSFPTITVRPTYPTISGSYPGTNRYQYQNNGNAPIVDTRAEFPSVRVITPVSPQPSSGNRHRPYHGYDPYPVYGGTVYGGSGVTIVSGPAVLGGYYYGGYSETYAGPNCYPSIYSVYTGFPSYIYNPGVIVLAAPAYPVYVTDYLPFYTPAYPVVYNENIYYVGSEERAEQIVHGDTETRRAALQNAYSEGSFQAAFGDIERAWTEDNIALLHKHLRNDDVKLSVFLKGTYSYSIASGDYLQMTRDAFDRLHTVSFKFDRLRKAKNGDVTAYGTHVYRASNDAGDQDSETAGDGTVPFNTDGSADTYQNTPSETSDTKKTTHLSYTLHHQDGQWNIIAIDSTPDDAAK